MLFAELQSLKPKSYTEKKGFEYKDMERVRPNKISSATFDSISGPECSPGFKLASSRNLEASS